MYCLQKRHAQYFFGSVTHHFRQAPVSVNASAVLIEENGKRSPRSLNQSGSRESAAVCNDGFEKELEGVPSLKDAGSFGGQQPGGKEFAVVGLIAEADLSPLDGRTYSPLRGVVGRLNPFVFEKGEQSVPVLEQALCGLALHRGRSWCSTCWRHLLIRLRMGTDFRTRVCLSKCPSLNACHRANIRPVSESIHLENLTASGLLQACLIPLIPLMMWAQQNCRTPS